MSGAGSAPANSRRPPLEPSAGTKKIGLIGLGLMGRPMGMNLIKAGHSLTVWNRTASRADELVAAGAKLAKSPQEVAAASDRSEERRVGKECRSRGGPDEEKKKKKSKRRCMGEDTKKESGKMER